MMFGLFKTPKTAEAHYNDALDHYEAGRYEKALKELQKASQLDSEFTEVYYTQGLCWLKLNQSQEAISAFQKALTLNPDDTDSLYNLAMLHYNNEDPDIALAYAEQADTLLGEQGDELVSYLLGLLYEQQGRLDDAIRCYEKSLTLNREQVLTGIFLGKLYIQKQEYTKAIDLLKQLAEHDPINLEVNYELSLCLAKISDWEGTVRYCQRVIEIDPTYKKGYNQLGLALYCMNQLEEARANYEKALELDPDYATALNNLAYTFEKMGEYEKAIEKFTAYIAFTEDRPDEKTELEEHIELLKQKMI